MESLIYKYPWLPSLGSYFPELKEKSLEEFILYVVSDPEFDMIKKQIFFLFKNALIGEEKNPAFYISEINPICFILTRVLLYLFSNKEITNRVANAYSKIHYNRLIDESELNLYKICKNLELDISFPPNSKGSLNSIFTVDYINYLSLSSNLRDDFRRLVNQQLSKGLIYIKKKKLIRLLQEVIREKMIEINYDIDDVTSDQKLLLKIPDFKLIYELILEVWETHKPKQRKFDNETLKIKNSTYFPPCIKGVFQKINISSNLTHEERLFLTWFLIAVKFDFEEIINIFKGLPDFNESKTEYQIKYAIKKKYMVQNCSKLKSLRLCYSKEYEDKICLEGYYSKKEKKKRKIIQPLTYVAIKRYRNRVSKQKNEQQ